MEDYIYRNFDVEKIDKKLKGRIKPQIYAFKTNTVPSFVKIGDTYRTVDERLSEWNKVYKDIFEFVDEINKQHNPFFVANSTLDNNKNIYFRDLSIHKYLRAKGKHQFEENDRKKYQIKKDQYVSKEFFLDVEKDDLNNAINDINEKYENESEYYDYYDVNTKENEGMLYDNKIELVPRNEQQKVIDKFVMKYKKLSKREFPKRYLIYAVMRFGKTFTSLCCAKEMGAKVVLVVSAKADVKNEWKKNVESVVNFKDYKFLDEKKLKSIKIKDVLNGNYNKNKDNDNEPNKDRVVIFLTLQDLKDVKTKFKELYKTKIDMLIVDETHFGAWAAKLGDIVDKAKNLEINEFENEDSENLSKIASFDDIKTINNEDCYSEDLEKQLNVKIILHLSGTPYNLLLRNKFNEEDILAEVTYSDILDYKKEWNDRFLKYEHIDDITNKKDLDEILKIKHYKSYDEYKEEKSKLLAKINATSNAEEKEKFINEYYLINKINEFENPYFGFPEMLRFAFNPTEESYKRIEELKKLDGSISLSLIFRPKSLIKSGEYKEFENKDLVLSILKSLDGKTEDKNVFPILDYVKNKERDIARHMVFVLPFCASCDALQELISKNEFYNLKDYKIINISGLDIEKRYENIENIKETIRECEKNNIKTITLTVERMLTGTTVPEWDTMIFFRDIQSAEHYDQAIYRLQNPYVVTIKDENNNYIKVDNKPQTLLIDFSLSRMFSFTEKRLFIQNVNQGKKDDALEEKIKIELQKSPIFVLKGQKMVDVEPTDLMAVVAKYSGYRSIIDDASEIRFNIDILNNDKLRDVIESQEVYDNGKFGLNINKFSDKNRQKISTILKKHKGEIVDIDNDDNYNKNKKKLDDYEILRKQWKVYWSRILFFAFLTNSTICTFNDMINILQNDIENLEDNKRIFKHLNIELKYLKIFYNLLSPEEVLNISKQIFNKNKLSHEEYLDDNEIRTEFDRRLKKVEVAIRSFSRLGESEIVTPMNICQDMVGEDKISDNELDRIIYNNKHILDINSKVAEFTSAFIKRLILQNRKDKYDIGDKRLYNLFYSIVSTKHAYEFTRYVYNLLNINIDNISYYFTSYDLINNENVCRSEKEILELKKQKNCIKKILGIVKKYYNMQKRSFINKKQQKNKNSILYSLKELIGHEKINNIVVKDYENGLNEELEIIEKKCSEKIDYNKISRILSQNKKFSDIKLSDKVKEYDDNMKFEFVVGNPPYQETVKEATNGNNKNAVDIYQHFQSVATELSIKTCMLYPAKEFQRGKKDLTEKSLVYLRIYNGSNKTGEKHIINEDSIFGDTVRRIPGDVGVFVYDKRASSKKIVYQNESIDRTELILPVIKELIPLAIKLKKYAGTFKFSNIKKVCESNFVEKNSRFILNKDVNRQKGAPIGYTKVLTNNKGGSGGEAHWYYIKTNKLDRLFEKKYKLVLPSAYPNESFMNPNNVEFLYDDEFFGRTKLAIYDDKNKKKVKDCKKYLSTKFARVICLMTPYSFLYYLPNFNDIYHEFDWAKPIEDIDKQLYGKYKLSKEEIAFIEKNIKTMK